MCKQQHSDGLQLLETSVGNIIRFTIKPDYDKCGSLHFFFRSTLCLMDRSYLTGKENEKLILLFPSKMIFLKIIFQP